MNDRIQRLFETTKALVSYIDAEDVFDKVGNMGCGGVDHHQSEAFYNLIAAARTAILDYERNMNKS